MDASRLRADSVPKRCEYLLTGVVCSGLGLDKWESCFRS